MKGTPKVAALTVHAISKEAKKICLGLMTRLSTSMQQMLEIFNGDDTSDHPCCKANID